MGKTKKERIIGVYSLKGIKGKSAIKIKHLETGKIGLDERIKDTSIHKYEIDKFITGEIFACNITDASLISSKKQPMLYVTIMMNKSLKAAILCNIILYFTIEHDIKSKDELLNNELQGKFSMEIMLQGKSRALDKEISIFQGNSKTIEMIESLTKDEDMIEVLKELSKIEEDKIIKKYAEEMEYFSIPKKIISLKDYKIDNEYDELSYSEEKEDDNKYNDKEKNIVL